MVDFSKNNLKAFELIKSFNLGKVRVALNSIPLVCGEEQWMGHKKPSSTGPVNGHMR